MKISLQSFVIFSLFFISCKNEAEVATSPAQPKTATLDAVVGSLTQSASAAVATTSSIQSKDADAPNSIMRSVKYTAVPVSTAKGMNPAHGVSGHRCDIAVGMPLNSAPANSTTISSPVQSTVSTQNVNSKMTVTPAVATAKGMNPPHGQPGHRCDITVGAPLNSAPAQVATNSPVANTSGTINQTINIPATPPMVVTPNTVTAPGMNPPHGQEGHRCDVAVGAALPK